MRELLPIIRRRRVPLVTAEVPPVPAVSPAPAEVPAPEAVAGAGTAAPRVRRGKELHGPADV